MKEMVPGTERHRHTERERESQRRSERDRRDRERLVVTLTPFHIKNHSKNFKM